jgi:hypothetical protein
MPIQSSKVGGEYAEIGEYGYGSELLATDILLWPKISSTSQTTTERGIE